MRLPAPSCHRLGHEQRVASATTATGCLELAPSKLTCLQGPAKVPQPRAESAVLPKAFEVKHAVGSKTLPYEELKGEVLQTLDGMAQSYPSCKSLLKMS